MSVVANRIRSLALGSRAPAVDIGSRSKGTGETKDLEEAVNITRQAVQSTPSDHPDLAVYLNNLGNMLDRRFECTGDMKDLESVIECYLRAFDCTGAVPLDCVKAAARGLSRLADLHKTHEAIKLGREAFEQLPIVKTLPLCRHLAGDS